MEESHEGLGVRDMNLDVFNEFEQMIYEIATDEQALPKRAVVALKRLIFLDPADVSEDLRGELRELKSSGERARDMNVDEARNFISRIISFRSKLQSSPHYRRGGLWCGPARQGQTTDPFSEA
jgi:hypothetical protein